MWFNNSSIYGEYLVIKPYLIPNVTVAVHNDGAGSIVVDFGDYCIQNSQDILTQMYDFIQSDVARVTFASALE